MPRKPASARSTAREPAALVRTSISIERDLFEQMERLVAESDYSNRSEFVRDLIRNRLVQERWRTNREAVGTITLVYDHERRQLTGRITHLQHDYHHAIRASVHVHLDERLCAEAILVKGRARLIQELADRLQRERGVLHASLSVTGTAE